MKVLLTGGTGFIGSHTTVELINNGYEVIIVDDLLNSSIETLDTIEELTGKKPEFYKVNILDEQELEKVFKDNDIDAIIHFAAFKAVNESVNNPLMYYKNNVSGSISLLAVAKKYNVKKIVFSSSAMVYGMAKTMPIKETDKLKPVNPYGSTKMMIERVLYDLYQSDKDWSIAILRYFNPIGAHPSGLLGENSDISSNNLIPYILKVLSGKASYLNVFGYDYDTPDKTPIRDYIHVLDLALAHIKALEYISKNKGVDAYNIGTGVGYGVLQVLEAFMRVNKVKIDYKIVGRREGDVPELLSDPSYANQKLGWYSKLDLDDMVRDSYNYLLKQNNKHKY